MSPVHRKIAESADIQCIVEYNPSKVMEKITNHFLSKLENIPKEYVQTQAGWVFWNSKYIFSHDARRNIWNIGSILIFIGRKYRGNERHLYELYQWLL